MSYTPLQLSAAHAIASNTAFIVNPELTAAIESFNSLDRVAVANSIIDAVEESDTLDIDDKVAIMESLMELPLSQDISLVKNDGGELVVSQHTVGVQRWAGELLPEDDQSLFAVHLRISSAYVKQTNELIRSISGASSVAASTFIDNNALVTGNLSLLSDNMSAFADELEKVGNAIDFSNIKNFGTPIGLFASLYRAGAITLLSKYHDGTVVKLSTILTDYKKTGRVVSAYQAELYKTFQKVTDSDLEICLALLQCEVAVDSLADLFDPVKLFPQSYPALQSVRDRRVFYVYQPVGDDLYGISESTMQYQVMETYGMPVDAIKACMALRTAFNQVVGIAKLTAKDLASVMLSMNLIASSTIVNQSGPIESDIQDSMLVQYANGTLDDGQYSITDCLGTVFGVNHIDFFQQSVTSDVDSGGDITGFLTTALGHVNNSDTASAVSAIETAKTFVNTNYSDDAEQWDTLMAASIAQMQQEKYALTRAQAYAWSGDPEQLWNPAMFTDGFNTNSGEQDPILFVGAIKSFIDTELEQLLPLVLDANNRGDFIAAVINETKNQSQLQFVGIRVDSSIPT